MKKKLSFLAYLLISFSIVSCESNALPDCNDPFVNMQLRMMLEEQFNKELRLISDSSEEELAELETFSGMFFDQGVDFEFIRKTKLDEELKSCNCAAQMTVQLDPVVKNYFERLSPEELNYLNSFRNLYLGPAEVRNLLKFPNIDLQFSLQTMENGEMFLETSVPLETLEVFGQYYLVNEAYNAEMKNNLNI